MQAQDACSASNRARYQGKSYAPAKLPFMRATLDTSLRYPTRRDGAGGRELKTSK